MASPRITPAWAGKRTQIFSNFCTIKDYPRVGGEEAIYAVLAALIAGLPPRGRGRGTPPRPPPPAGGITPAWAGKRCAGQPRRGGGGDYPRVGGEEAVALSPAARSTGLPPRGRGRGHARRTRGNHRGITPAWAGKSRIYIRRRTVRRDYPRVGGEEALRVTTEILRAGLPPRGRGRVFTRRAHRHNGGITPAWAGKSYSSSQKIDPY